MLKSGISNCTPAPCLYTNCPPKYPVLEIAATVIVNNIITNIDKNKKYDKFKMGGILTKPHLIYLKI